MDQFKGITRLGLEGFQVFAEKTDLDLSKITLLFGPNSAGKSSVEDAIKILFSQLPGYDSQEFSKLEDLDGFDRHIRRDENGTDSTQTCAMEISKVVETVDVWVALLQAWSTVLPADYYPHRTKNFIDFMTSERLEQIAINFKSESALVYYDNDQFLDGEKVPSRIQLLSLSLFDELFFSFQLDEFFSINIGHSLFSSSFQEEIKKSFSQLHDNLEMKDGWLTLTAYITLSKDFTVVPSNNSLKSEVNLLFEAIPRFLGFLNGAIGLIRMLSQYPLRTAEASRNIPSEQDLTFFTSHRRSETAYDNNFLNRFKLTDAGDKRYRQLAESLRARDLIDPAVNSDKYLDYSGIARNVNHALTDYLFIERGYCLAADYISLIPSSQIKRLDVEQRSVEAQYSANRIISAFDENYAFFPQIMRIFLKDDKGREFSFQEVGSGLGYVLPVLTAIYGGPGLPGLNMPMALIQQPELHLHPALQAALGDVLVDACNKGTQIICETHSEHLLLRILKRIRQTSNGTLQDSELAIRPEDVSVLYFEPQPNGTTAVHKIRISSDGDFLDRWPRGFFPERDSELFDE